MLFQVVVYKVQSGVLGFVPPARQHDGGPGGEGEPAGELDWRQRPGRSGRCRDILLRVRPQRSPSDIQPPGTSDRLLCFGRLNTSECVRSSLIGRDENVHVHAGRSHKTAQVNAHVLQTAKLNLLFYCLFDSKQLQYLRTGLVRVHFYPILKLRRK